MIRWLTGAIQNFGVADDEVILAEMIEQSRQPLLEQRQPMLTLHGHIHESARLSGEWKIRIGRTVCINGAHDGPELALVRFDLESPSAATRELL